MSFLMRQWNHRGQKSLDYWHKQEVRARIRMTPCPGVLENAMNKDNISLCHINFKAVKIFKERKRRLGEPPTLSGPGIWRHLLPLEYSRQKKVDLSKFHLFLPQNWFLSSAIFFFYQNKAQNITNNLTPPCLLVISI